jgi:dephospho-CoA kinase
VAVIGLIGGIGAGKSRVAALLAESGAKLIDADVVGHALLDQRPVRDEVVARFGPDVLDRAGADAGAPPRIDRRALGAIVFADPAALRRLEAILHPRMRRTFERAIAREARRGQGPGCVVLDAAILLEAGWDALCDRIVFVDAPREVRLARLAEARGWTAAMLADREAAQWPLDRKRARADVVVVNDDGIEPLAEQVRRLAAPFLPPAGPVRGGGRGGGAAAATVTTPTTGPDQTGPGSLPPSNSNTRSTVHRPR